MAHWLRILGIYLDTILGPCVGSPYISVPNSLNFFS